MGTDKREGQSTTRFAVAIARGFSSFQNKMVAFLQGLLRWLKGIAVLMRLLQVCVVFGVSSYASDVKPVDPRKMCV